MTTHPKPRAESPNQAKPTNLLAGENQLKNIRFSELDADFKRQAKQLKRFVNRLKKDIHKRSDWAFDTFATIAACKSFI